MVDKTTNSLFKSCIDFGWGILDSAKKEVQTPGEAAKVLGSRALVCSVAYGAFVATTHAFSFVCQKAGFSTLANRIVIPALTRSHWVPVAIIALPAVTVLYQLVKNYYLQKAPNSPEEQKKIDAINSKVEDIASLIDGTKQSYTYKLTEENKEFWDSVINKLKEKYPTRDFKRNLQDNDIKLTWIHKLELTDEEQIYQSIKEGIDSAEIGHKTTPKTFTENTLPDSIRTTLYITYPEYIFIFKEDKAIHWEKINLDGFKDLSPSQKDIFSTKIVEINNQIQRNSNSLFKKDKPEHILSDDFDPNIRKLLESYFKDLKVSIIDDKTKKKNEFEKQLQDILTSIMSKKTAYSYTLKDDNKEYWNSVFKELQTRNSSIKFTRKQIKDHQYSISGVVKQPDPSEKTTITKEALEKIISDVRSADKGTKDYSEISKNFDFMSVFVPLYTQYSQLMFLYTISKQKMTLNWDKAALLGFDALSSKQKALFTIYVNKIGMLLSSKNKKASTSLDPELDGKTKGCLIEYFKDKEITFNNDEVVVNKKVKK